ncbi:MAG: hypothetical protein H0U27_10915 [Nitrosopumilus sp.]|nr:hypothetical protein [Nitrosopumilus sp.]
MNINGSQGFNRIARNIGDIPKNIKNYIEGRAAQKADGRMELFPAPPRPAVKIDEKGNKIQQKLSVGDKVINGVFGVTAAPLMLIGHASVAAYKNSLLNRIDKNTDTIKELKSEIKNLKETIDLRKSGLEELKQELFIKSDDTIKLSGQKRTEDLLKINSEIAQGKVHQNGDNEKLSKLETKLGKLENSKSVAEARLQKFHQAGQMLRGESNESPNKVNAESKFVPNEKVDKLNIELGNLKAKIGEKEQIISERQLPSDEIELLRKEVKELRKTMVETIQIKTIIIKQEFIENQKELIIKSQDLISKYEEKISNINDTDIALKLGLNKQINGREIYISLRQETIDLLENEISELEETMANEFWDVNNTSDNISFSDDTDTDMESLEKDVDFDEGFNHVFDDTTPDIESLEKNVDFDEGFNLIEEKGTVIAGKTDIQKTPENKSSFFKTMLSKKNEKKFDKLTETVRVNRISASQISEEMNVLKNEIKNLETDIKDLEISMSTGEKQKQIEGKHQEQMEYIASVPVLKGNPEVEAKVTHLENEMKELEQERDQQEGRLESLKVNLNNKTFTLGVKQKALEIIENTENKLRNVEAKLNKLGQAGSAEKVNTEAPNLIEGDVDFDEGFDKI